MHDGDGHVQNLLKQLRAVSILDDEAADHPQSQAASSSWAS
jgi:hypothetical protein